VLRFGTARIRFQLVMICVIIYLIMLILSVQCNQSPKSSWCQNFGLKSSVADPGCLSRVPDPDFYPYRIPDPTATEEKGKNLLLYFFCAVASHKCHKIENYFIFEGQKIFLQIYKEL
jgi:hypothetical protein